jgi:hypothetical protein
MRPVADRRHAKERHVCATRLFPLPYPLFPIPYSLFPIPCSLFPIPCPLLRPLKQFPRTRSAIRRLYVRAPANDSFRVADQTPKNRGLRQPATSDPVSTRCTNNG